MFKIASSSTILLIAVFFVYKLAVLQLHSNKIADLQNNETIEKVDLEAERGHIYDRNNKLLVYNQPAYNISIIPEKLKPFDTLELCNLLKITKITFLEKYSQAVSYSRFKKSIVVKGLSKERYAAFKEKLRKYKGVYVKQINQRKYSEEVASNIFGYIGEISNRKLKEVNGYYKSGDLIGIQGIESQYEEILCGKRGVAYREKDRLNRILGSYKNGKYDESPVNGKDIHLTIDLELQKYAEQLMKGKRGGVVIIEPETGEVLALVSSPKYAPSLLVGKDSAKNYKRLEMDSIGRPLYDRGLLAMYPPGSTFKPMNALIALQEGVVKSNTKIICMSRYKYGRGSYINCHCQPNTINNMNSGIYNSCNTYFATIYRRILDKYNNPEKGIDIWSRYVKSFGLGDFLGYDLPIGKRGNIPTSALYNKKYDKGKWQTTFTISNAIGQGEILVTPIQLANFSSTIANKGFYYPPHFIKKIDNKIYVPNKFTKKKKTLIDEKNFDPVIEGMKNLYEKGILTYLKLKNTNIAAKTGTAENYTIINGNRVQLTDHSIFLAFAPIKKPKIAIAVFVENAYWGSRYAAPIATLCIDKYLNKVIEKKYIEKLMLSKSLQAEYEKPFSGNPFKINQNEW